MLSIKKAYTHIGFCVLLLIFSSIKTSAQVYLGFEGGWVGSTFSDTPEEREYYTPLQDFTYGIKLQANFKTAPRFSFQTGLNLSTRGADYYYDNTRTETYTGFWGEPYDVYYYDVFKQQWQANYLHVPATVKFTVFNNPGIYFSGGIYIAQLLKGEGSYYDTLSKTDSDGRVRYITWDRGTVDLKETFNTTDFGLLGSMGIQLKIREAFLIYSDLSYQYGLVGIPKVNTELKNRALLLNFGILYMLPKSSKKQTDNKGS